MADDSSEWVTTWQISKMIGISPDSARRMCERGAWPSGYQSRPGAAWRVKRSEVVKWLAALQPKRRRRSLDEVTPQPAQAPPEKPSDSD